MGHSKPLTIMMCAILLAGGCATTKRTQPFLEDDFARYAGGGRNVFDGHISFEYMGIKGIIETGNFVVLTPETAYTYEWYQKEVLGGKTLDPADSRLKKYQRTAQVDQNGDYHFESLAPGNYYLTGTIRYSNPFNPNDVREQDVHSRISLQPARSVSPPARVRPSEELGLRL